MTDNPYAAPTAGSEQGRATGGLHLSDELRAQIVGVARLLLVAGAVQILPASATLLTEGITQQNLVVAALLGVVPVFMMMGGLALLGLARAQSDDLATLLSGMRQLTVAFAIKGVVLVTFIVVALASLVFGFSLAALR